MANREYQNFVIRTTMSVGGRIIRITPSFLAYLVELEKRVGSEKAVVLSEEGHPVLVDDVRAFLDRAWDTYHKALNDYFDRVHENTRRNRDVIGSLKTTRDEDE